MTNENKTRIRSTVSAAIAILVAFGPDILEAIDATDASPKWVKMVAKALGLLVMLATSGKGVALLNRLLPTGGMSAGEADARAQIDFLTRALLVEKNRADGKDTIAQ